MSTPKHTPGPWQLVKAGKRINQLNIIGRNDRWVTDAHPFNKGKEPTEEMIANARLIAASPELLEACKALLDLTLPSRCNVRPHEDCGCYSCQQYNAIEFIQAAIDKATKGEAE